ncbi:hypothetical protein, partial [Aromatoleum toluclasticum]|uniref:hypothetical protein n=1 Tax=Aromatoleum toluclasticum TaxID=92003 RepID=UPI0022608CA8
MSNAARCQKQTNPHTGTTEFRPNYTPITFGAIAGLHCRELFDPRRFTALHSWHEANGEKFEEVGQWMRPWYFPRGNET